MSTRVTCRSSRSSKNTMSAHLPGAMEPSSWSIWKHWAQLMVTIWMAVHRVDPHSTAVRTM